MAKVVFYPGDLAVEYPEKNKKRRYYYYVDRNLVIALENNTGVGGGWRLRGMMEMPSSAMPILGQYRLPLKVSLMLYSIATTHRILKGKLQEQKVD